MIEDSAQIPIKLVSAFDLCLLGITIVICGQYFTWNTLGFPFIEFLVSTIIISLGYLMLVMCIGEMISALPFSGGQYGLARVARSPYAGFMVGILEISNNIFTIASIIIPFGQFITETVQVKSKYEPLWWLVVLVIGISGNLIGGKFFWMLNRIFALSTIFILFIYFLTPITNHTDFQKYALPVTDDETSNYHIFHWRLFFQYSPFAISWFLGVELIPFACIYTKYPTKSIPRALIGSVLILIILSIIVYFIGSSQAPGVISLSSELMPLSYGFSKMLGISKTTANWLTFTSMISSVFGFLFGGGREIWSMSTSRLLPTFLQNQFESTNVPYVAILSEGIAVYLVMLFIRYGLSNNTNIIYYLYVLNSAIVYVTTFLTFLLFKKKYTSLKRDFQSPFGLWGAYLGILIFSIVFASTLGLQNDPQFYIAPVSVGVILIIATIYYFGYAQKIQCYSTEEQKAFLIAYVINSNSRSRKKLNNRGSFLVSPQKHGSVDLSKSPQSIYHSSIMSMSILSSAKSTFSGLPLFSSSNKSSKISKVVPIVNDSEFAENDLKELVDQSGFKDNNGMIDFSNLNSEKVVTRFQKYQNLLRPNQDIPTYHAFKEGLLKYSKSNLKIFFEISSEKLENNISNLNENTQNNVHIPDSDVEKFTDRNLFHQQPLDSQLNQPKDQIMEVVDIED